jgi:hypothetical protein
VFQALLPAQSVVIGWRVAPRRCSLCAVLTLPALHCVPRDDAATAAVAAAVGYVIVVIAAAAREVLQLLR